MSAVEDLRTAVAELHRRLDAWAASVEGVAAESDDLSDAASDPRLNAAEEAFDDALSDVHSAAGVVLGLPPLLPVGDPDEVDLTDEDDDGADLVVDEFFLHLLVGVPSDRPEEMLDQALAAVDEGALQLVERLEAAGFVVPTYSVSRGEPDEWDGEDEEER